MKKVLSLIFAVLFTLSLAACAMGGASKPPMGEQEESAEPVRVLEISDETLLMHRALIPTTDETTGETGYFVKGEWEGKSVCWVTFENNGQMFPAPLNETTIYRTQGQQNYLEQVQFSYKLSDGTAHEVVQYRIYLAQEEQPFPDLAGQDGEA